jgi:hypothetical protein
MRKLRLSRALIAVALLAFSWTWLDAREQAAAPSRPATPPAQSHKATLDKYCVTCHSDRLKTAGLTLNS